MWGQIQKLKKQTAWGSVAVHKQMQVKGPEGWNDLSFSVVNSIMYKHTQTVCPSAFKLVVAVLEGVPKDKWQIDTARKSTKRRTVTPEFANELSSLVDRYKQLSTSALLKYLGAPERLSHYSINRIIQGKQTSLKSEHFEFLEQCFENLRNGKV